MERVPSGGEGRVVSATSSSVRRMSETYVVLLVPSRLSRRARADWRRAVRRRGRDGRVTPRAGSESGDRGRGGATVACKRAHDRVRFVQVDSELRVLDRDDVDHLAPPFSPFDCLGSRVLVTEQSHGPVSHSSQSHPFWEIPLLTRIRPRSLDADLLARTPSYLSPLRDREIDLRGHKIPAIENLAVTRDQLDSIDLTDNQIHALANLPVLKRLSQLLLANNPVRTVSVNLATSLPNLRTLVLTNAAIPKDALAHTAVTLGRCRKLEHLSLKGCPVQHAQHYKDWIIFNCKKLRSLDFERVHLKVSPSFHRVEVNRHPLTYAPPGPRTRQLALPDRNRRTDRPAHLVPRSSRVRVRSSRSLARLVRDQDVRAGC